MRATQGANHMDCPVTLSVLLARMIFRFPTEGFLARHPPQLKEDSRMKYIAYGSNMVEEQMAHRCPDATRIGTRYLPNHRLAFFLHAAVERTRAHKANVPVAVWKISEADERSGAIFGEIFVCVFLLPTFVKIHQE